MTLQPSAFARQLDRLLGKGDRIAVIDVETTGLYNTDRVVEIGIITLNGKGEVIETFETLVNPLRDVGPTWIHQVTPSMVVEAPTFEEIAHHVAARLDGAVCAAHNLPFDTRMIGNELARVGISIDWGAGLDTLTVTGCKLGVACKDFGIKHPGPHRAAHDAQAVALLLACLAEKFNGVYAPALSDPVDAAAPIRIYTRDGHTQADAPIPYLAKLARGVHVTSDVAPYVDLLDSAISDLRLTDLERTDLTDLAGTLGLSPGHIARAHREFLDGLIDAAHEDGVVTEAEHDQLCRAAALLDIDSQIIERRTDHYRSTSTTLPLTPGLTVCFTGDARTEAGFEISREFLEETAARYGLVPVSSVTKKGCGLLIAADPASQSGKAGKARNHGIPIGSVEGFLDALESATPLGVTQLTGTVVALVCTECGDSWLAARKSARPVCAACKAQKALQKRQASGLVTAAPTVETLNCVACGRSCERDRVRGSKPQLCSGCT